MLSDDCFVHSDLQKSGHMIKMLITAAGLCNCGVSSEICSALSSALRSNPSHLRYLDLSMNKIGDSGVKILSTVLKNPHCKLVRLKLFDCLITEEGCAALISALRSNPSHLRDLYLSGNKLGDSGNKTLSEFKDNENYKLQTLW
ncbi:Ribonuclease inhibitor [Bagarius yarrelli]|uniref:Ribonuclease inhibitor n=1 Tax=Bagarius yarrelli TaxID=175774 RepID=A0A556TMA8_BAGYA|nr:Ribonuclease inhibitor [Bagarius yarrelli]